MEAHPEKPNNDTAKKWSMATLALELGFVIALPLLVFALTGKWLDRKFNTYPTLTLTGIAFAIISTTLWIVKKLKTYIK